jgi:hypothetical protein
MQADNIDWTSLDYDTNQWQKFVTTKINPMITKGEGYFWTG